MIDKERLLNLCYTEQTQEDIRLSKENLAGLKTTQDVEAFQLAERKREKVFKNTSKDIKELLELLDEKGVE